MTKLDESWQRYLEARVRLPGEQQLQALIDGLAKDGMMLFYKGVASLDHENQGVYLTISTSAGKYPDILPVSIDVFIPVPKAMMPKPGKSLEEINKDFEKESNQRPTTTSEKAELSGGEISISDDRRVHDLKSTQMDVVGDVERHVDASSSVGSGTNEGPELTEVPAVGEGIQSEV